MRMILAPLILFCLLFPTLALCDDCMAALGQWEMAGTEAAVLRDSRLYYGRGGVLVAADVSLPEQPVDLGEVDLAGYDAYSIRHIELSGTLAFAVISNTVYIVDISRDAWPVLLGSFSACELDGYAARLDDLRIRDHWVFVAGLDTDCDWDSCHFHGILNVFDVEDPVHPVLRGLTRFGPEYNNSSMPEIATCSIDVAGPYAYLLRERLWILDVSDPDIPAVAADREVTGRDLRIADQTAYVSHHGLSVYELAGALDPVAVGCLPLEEESFAFALDGGRAYIGSESGIRILDVSDPARPSQLGVLATTEPAGVMGEQDGTAVFGLLKITTYSYSHTKTITVTSVAAADVSDPAEPALLWTWENPGKGHDIVAFSGWAYVAAGYGGLRIYDVSNPSRVIPVASLALPGEAYQILLYGPFAFVNCWDAGIRIIDILDPVHPVEMGAYAPEGDVWKMRIAGDVLYLNRYHEHGQDRDYFLDTISLADPVHPVLLASLPVHWNLSYGFMVRPPYAYLPIYFDTGVEVVDISDPRRPFSLGISNLPGSHTLLMGEGWALTKGESANYLLYEMPDPLHAVPLGSIPYAYTSAYSGLALLSGSDALLDDGDGLSLYDLSDPAHPVQRAHLATHEKWESMFMDGNVVYGITFSEGGRVLTLFGCGRPAADFEYTPLLPAAGQEVKFVSWASGDTLARRWDFDDGGTSDASAPVHVFAAPGSYEVVLTVGNAAGASEVRRRIDVLQERPCLQEVARTETLGWALAVSSDGRYGYALTDGPSLVVYDLSFLPEWRRIGLYQAEARGDDFWVLKVDGPLVYIGTQMGDLTILDVSDPAHPLQRSHLERVASWESILDIGVGQGRVVISDENQGLTFIDATDPTQPVVTGTYGTCGDYLFYTDLLVRNNVVWANQGKRIDIISFSDPANPVKIAEISPGWYGTGGMAVTGPWAIVTTGTLNVWIVDIHTPDAPVLVSTFQTPFAFTDVMVLPDDRCIFSVYGRGKWIYDIHDLTNPVLIDILNRPLSDAAYYASGDTLLAVSKWETRQYRFLTCEGGHRFAPKADYDCSACPGVAGILGQFRDVSLYYPTQWRWDFGDGSSSALQNPWHTYVAAGYYTVTLEVRNAYGLDRCERQIQVKAYRPEDCIRLSAELHLEQIYAREMLVVQPFIYLLFKDRLDVLDVSNPAAPVTVAEAGPFREAQKIARWQDRLLVKDADGLHFLDVSDPLHPATIGESAMMASVDVDDIAWDGSRLFIVSRKAGLWAFDVSDPTAPVFLSAVTTMFEPVRMELAGDVVFVVSLGEGLCAFNMGDPSLPLLLGRLPDERLVNLALSGFRLYLSGTEEVAAMDVSDPSNPLWLGAYPVASEYLAVSGRMVLSSDKGKLSLLDFSDVQRPREFAAASGFSLQRAGFSYPFLYIPRNDYSTSSLLVWDISMCTSPTDYFIPAAAHGPGARQTEWRTDVLLHNPGNDPVECALTYLEAGMENTDAAAYPLTVGPRRSLPLPDLVLTLFGRPGTVGAVRVSSEAKLLADSRTYTTVGDGGTYGQAIPGLDGSHSLIRGEEGRLIGLIRSPRFRTNLGLVNTSGAPVSAEAILHSAEGVPLASRTFDLPGFGFHQENDALAAFGVESLEHGWMSLSSASPFANFYAYASIVDAETGDSTLSGLQKAGEQPRPYQYVLPAAASLPGAYGSQWHTDVELHNAGDTSAELELYFLQSGMDNRDRVSGTASIPPRSSIAFEDIVGVFLGQAGASGAVRIDSTAPLVGLSRTYTSAAQGGTYGQTVPLISAAEGVNKWSRQENLLIGLLEDRNFRTNLGFVNLSEAPVNLEAYFYSASGEYLGALVYALGPRMHLHDESPLARIGARPTQNAYAIVTSKGGGSWYLAYASVIDNATGDAVFNMARH